MFTCSTGSVSVVGTALPVESSFLYTERGERGKGRGERGKGGGTEGGGEGEWRREKAEATNHISRKQFQLHILHRFSPFF